MYIVAVRWKPKNKVNKINSLFEFQNKRDAESFMKEAISMKAEVAISEWI